MICVIEDYKKCFAFEKVGNFNGTYHVLNGLISPMNNVSPEDINIKSLVSRVKKLDNPELILALKSSIEGEKQLLYILKNIWKAKCYYFKIILWITNGSWNRLSWSYYFR